MIRAKDRTIDVYKRVGAEMRLLKSILSKVTVDVSKVLTATETDKIINELDKICLICSKAEENMFKDYPKLSNEYTDVFYGALNYEPRNEVDAEIIETAKRVADELFK